MTAAIEDMQVRALACSDGGEKLRALDLGGPNLQVGVARTAQRPCPEERSPEIGTAAASSRQHALRRVLERPV
jgi:hypothetical protein